MYVVVFMYTAIDKFLENSLKYMSIQAMHRYKYIKII